MVPASRKLVEELEVSEGSRYKLILVVKYFVKTKMLF